MSKQLEKQLEGKYNEWMGLLKKINPHIARMRELEKEMDKLEWEL